MLIETDYRALLDTGQVLSQDNIPQNIAGGVVVIGNFDGVHLGHQALLAQAKKMAISRNIPLVVLTFNPHPRLYFAPNQPEFLIAMPQQKSGLLHECGVDYVVNMAFNSDLANASADDFVAYVLVHGLRASAVFVGENFVFGKERKGNLDTLRQWGQKSGFDVHAIALAQDETGRVSSGRISSGRVREALQSGDIVLANHLLGRPWQITGKVIKGHQRGRTIGFPTANISLGNYVHPAFGAYAANITLLADGSTYPAVVNIGKRPTIGDELHPLVEVHLLDFNGDLYGQEVAVDFIDFIRPERKFDSLDALKEQIHQDVIQAKVLLDLS